MLRHLLEFGEDSLVELQELLWGLAVHVKNFHGRDLKPLIQNSVDDLPWLESLQNMGFDDATSAIFEIGSRLDPRLDAKKLI